MTPIHRIHSPNEHATHAALRARNADLDLYVVFPGVRIIREETPALRRPVLLPLPGPRVAASRADKALGMERMRRHLGAASGLCVMYSR